MHRYRITVDGKPFTLDVRELGADEFRVQVGGKELTVRLADDEELVEGSITPAMDGAAHRIAQVVQSRTTPVVARRSARDNVSAVSAPLPGLIVSVDVQPGTVVSRGDLLLTLEAMKMRNPVRSPREGIVAEVLVAEGQSVGFGEVLLRFGESS